MSYKVVVPCVIAKDRDGHSHHYYMDAVIQWLSDEQAKHFLAENLVEKVSGGAESADGPPAKTALKEDWVKYVVAKTANTAEPLTAEDADAYNKSDLIDLYG